MKHNQKILKILLLDYKRTLRVKNALRQFHYVYYPNPFSDMWNRMAKWEHAIYQIITEGW